MRIMQPSFSCELGNHWHAIIGFFLRYSFNYFFFNYMFVFPSSPLPSFFFFFIFLVSFFLSVSPLSFIQSPHMKLPHLMMFHNSFLIKAKTNKCTKKYLKSIKQEYRWHANCWHLMSIKECVSCWLVKTKYPKYETHIFKEFSVF